MIARSRRLAVGAEWLGPDAGVSFRVWAPKRSRVDVVFDDGSAPFALTAEEDGYFSGTCTNAKVGVSYRLRLDGNKSFPDPASRWQPDGPHGASVVVDPNAYRWNDEAWRGVPRDGHVMYEMHIGTFTKEGTFAAAARELPELVRLGVTLLEVMPIGEFPGTFGWGYDGVDLFAPTRLYGEPDDVRRFVDAAHAAGLGVILDVVYNHFGPDGNYLSEFSDTYFSPEIQTDWGSAIHFSGPGSAGVRDMILANVRYWMEEFHVDGYRLDATQEIRDDADRHILAAITEAVKETSRGRGTIVVGENESQTSRLVRAREGGGYGLDALWNDDFHHTAIVALTGKAEAYYSDYLGSPQEFVSAAKRGFLYQGQHYAWQKKGRGTPSLDLPPSNFVAFLENHDQVANSLRGARVHQHSSPGGFRAMSTLLLLGPAQPLLFQGQEFASSKPFLFFADHTPELAALVRQGRRDFLHQFRSIATPAAAGSLLAPDARSTFESCKLDFRERETNAGTYALYGDLLRLRGNDPLFRRSTRGAVDGAVLGPMAFVLRFFGEAGDDRLLVVNLGAEVVLAHVPEPLLAPGADRAWRPIFASEDPRYGGSGAPSIEEEGRWHLPGLAAVVLTAEKGR